MITELHDRFYDELLKFAKARCKDSGEAEDIVQEAFIRAMANIHLLQMLDEREQRAWLYRVVKNCLADCRRRDAREPATDDVPDDPEESDPAFLQDAMTLVGHLKPQYQQVIIQKFWLGMNSQEMARAAGIPSATVRFRLHSALHQLKLMSQKSTWAAHITAHTEEL